MTQYAYKATDYSGKIIRGAVEAKDEKGAVGLIHDQGLIPIKIQQAGATQKFSGASNPLALFTGVSTRDVLMFTQDLSSLIQAGLPIDRALKTLVAVTENRKLQTVIEKILKAVQGGSYLSDAMASHPKAFSDFYVNMIKAGEAGGALDAVLQRLSIFLENTRELKDEIMSALYYPAFIVFTSGVSIIILMIYVIPKFSVLFSDMGQAIPLSTRFLIGFSQWFREYWWSVVIMLAACIYFIYRYGRTQMGGARLDRYKLKLPIIGDIVRNVEVSRFARTLGTLMSSGVPILQAIDLVKDVMGNKVIADALGSIHEKIKEGERLSDRLAEAGVFPSLAVQMITVGEETGNLDQMLMRVAENYEKTVRRTIQRFISLLEPAMILLMGLLVGFIVISMLTAIFSINSIPF